MNKHTQSAGTSGIKRESKRALRHKKRAQHQANMQARADQNRAGPRKGK